MDARKLISTRSWSGEKFVEFFSNFNREEIIRATMKDEEMSCHVHSLSYLIRAHNDYRLFFEPIDSDLISVVIKMTYEEFLFNLKKKVEAGESELFDWYFEDSDIKESGDIFHESDAIMVMRDQMIGLMMRKIVKSVFVMGVPDADLDQSPYTKILFKYNSKKHQGKKFNCYKNHILLNYSGLLMFGASMLYQNEVSLSEVEDFDLFCNKFEPFLMEVMSQAEIEKDEEVNKSTFVSDIKKITSKLVQRNFVFCGVNYKPEPSINFFNFNNNSDFVANLMKINFK